MPAGFARENKPFSSGSYCQPLDSTISVAYFCGFLPWGFLVLVDSISARWKTIRHTRRSGQFYILFSFLPMMVVVLYAVFQGLSGDFKEMMTAITAVLLTCYHMARTAWGLAQLNAYKAWCSDALNCIHYALGRSSIEDSNDDKLDGALMVNNDLVDNEFTGRDLVVKVSLTRRNIKLSNPELCTVRWSAAFLCSLGHEWRSSWEMPTIPLNSYIVWYLCRCTFPFRAKYLLSVGELLDTWEKEGLMSGAFGSCINPFKPRCSGRSQSSLDTLSFEFANIVGSYPADQGNIISEKVQENRRAATLDQAELLLIAKGLGTNVISAMISEQKRSAFENDAQRDMAWDVFLRQLYPHRKVLESFWDLHPLFRSHVLPAWSEVQNKYVLQASVLLDIQNALFVGYMFHITEKAQVLNTGDPFRTSRSNFLSLDQKDMPDLRPTIGIALEEVRMSHAKWAQFQSSPIPKLKWLPRIPQDPFEFFVSQYVCDVPDHLIKRSKAYFRSRVLFECQSALQDALARLDYESSDVPASARAIMLFLCAYPSLIANWSSGDGISYFELIICPMNVPQPIMMKLLVNRKSRNAALRIIADDGIETFNWERWINSAMGLMKGQQEFLRRASLAEEALPEMDLISPVDLTHPMVSLEPPHSELPFLPGRVQIWTAWPLYNVRVCQFEKNQWMNAYGGFSERFMDYDKLQEKEKRRREAEESLGIIARWYTDGRRGIDDGQNG